jgi:hypothetical protein
MQRSAAARKQARGGGSSGEKKSLRAARCELAATKLSSEREHVRKWSGGKQRGRTIWL